MAIANKKLIQALRTTSKRVLDPFVEYEWGHMGRCNCGHLVQVISGCSDKEITTNANHQLDEWSEHANDYCEGTGMTMQGIFMEMKKVGLDAKDFKHLEYLSDPQVLRVSPKKKLRRNNREDVSLYFNTMANMLEAQAMRQ